MEYFCSGDFTAGTAAKEAETMDFILEIACDNAAFDGDPSPELARLLRAAADKVEAGTLAGGLVDINGNRCGYYETREAR